MIVNFDVTNFSYKIKQKNYRNTNSIAPLTSKSDIVVLSCKKTSFSGLQKLTSIGFEDFEKQLSKSKISLNDLLRNNVKKENLLGTGAYSRVYSITGIDDYVIKVFKDKTQNLKNKTYKIEPENNPFEDKNIGQPIAKIADGILVLKRQHGEEHSIKNWSERIKDPNTLTKQDAKKFLSDVQKIAHMPKSTFKDMAETIAIAQKNNYKMDSINPNNLLIDYKRKSLNLVDLYRIDRPDFQQNSATDMISGLLDFTLYADYHKLLDSKEQKSLVKASNTIAKKCFNAAKKASLPTDEGIFNKFATKVGKYFDHEDFSKEKGHTRGYKQRYTDFKALVTIPQEKNSKPSIIQTFVDMLTDTAS